MPRQPHLSVMPRLFPVLAALTLSASLVGCGITDTNNGPPALDIAHTTFASSLGVNPSTMTVNDYGVYYRDDVVGTGATASANGATAYVDYVGWLSDGTQFDASPAGTPLSFPIGYNGVIAGFQIGVIGMQEGGTRTIIVPSGLGYGSSTVKTGGGVTIPPNANLVFRITLDSLR